MSAREGQHWGQKQALVDPGEPYSCLFSLPSSEGSPWEACEVGTRGGVARVCEGALSDGSVTLFEAIKLTQLLSTL